MMELYKVQRVISAYDNVQNVANVVTYIVMAEVNSKINSKKRVYVGMSGGVDSSVSAALLVKAGYDVTGVFIKVWQPDEEISGLRCTWREDRLDAMRVAAVLGIRFVTLDLEAEYKKHVVDYMISEYRAGRTPNPDVMCNKYVKFGGFFDWAMKQGADFVATGHYAQTYHIHKTQSSEKIGQLKKTNSVGAGIFSAAHCVSLIAGDDANKDQSYFLWTLTQQQLSKTIFPVGHIEKPEVRKLAKKFGLPTADKKDSQGLCFIGKIDIKDFLSHYIKPKKGEVLDTTGKKGKVIGSHNGAFFFTIGERHGFSIDDSHKTPNDQPYYVISKDASKNTITVSMDIKKENHVKRVSLRETNWTQGFAPKVGEEFLARSRYRAPLVPVRISFVSDYNNDSKNKSKNTCTVDFNDPQSTITAGQSLVIYEKSPYGKGLICLGGGIIGA